MTRLVLLAALLLGFILPAQADFPVGFPQSGGSGGGSSTTTPGGLSPSNFTCTLVSVPASSTEVTLTAASSYITILNTSTANTIYFNSISPAAATNFPILPNSAFTYAGTALSHFYLISSTGTTNNVGILAH